MQVISDVMQPNLRIRVKIRIVLFYDVVYSFISYLRLR